MSCTFLCVLLKTVILTSASHVSHLASLFSVQHDTPTSSSLLYPPNRTNPRAPQPGFLFGRFTEQSPLTGCEPNAPVEVSSTEVTTTLLHSRKASIGSTYNSGEDIVTTLAVSQVDERSDLGMLASPLLTHERDRRDSFQNLSLKWRKFCGAFVPVRRDPWRCAQTKENHVETQMLCRSLIRKERGFCLSIEKSATSLNCELIKLPEDKKLLYLRLSVSEAEYRTILLLEEQKNYLLSEALSKLDMQELRVERAHRALQESGLQLHSQRMELYQENQLFDHSKREKNRLCTELDRRERVLQEDRMRTLQEIEELKNMCCTEAARAKQLRMDELSILEKESQSTVTQLTVPIQKIPNKVNSLSDFKEFYDPETASSPGLSHVLSHPVSIPSLREMLTRDSCLQVDTRNSFGESANVFEYQPAPNEPSAAFFGYSRTLAATQHRKMCSTSGRIAILTPRFARAFSSWNPPIP